MYIFILILIALTIAGPLSLIIRKEIRFSGDYRTANRNSANLAPNPAVVSEALIQVYAARAFKWRGFALHTWIAVKEKEAEYYTIYQVIGWRVFRNLSSVVIDRDIPDRHWFDQKPRIILDKRGVEAEDIIKNIAKTAAEYSYINKYRTWPGPNSNTFIATIARQNPELGLVLPSNALGKDFLPLSSPFVKAPSNTGYQFSLWGLFGIILARKEGFEINFLGFVYGFSPFMRVIKLPGIGDIKL